MKLALALLAASSIWQSYSSQSALPWGLNFIAQRVAPPGISLLHVSASVGVPSYSGHPLGNSDCINAIETASPLAKQLASERARGFARQLGIVLVRVEQYVDLSWSSGRTSGLKQNRGDCGIPKFGLPPVTASVSETYVMRAPSLVLRDMEPAAPAVPVSHTAAAPSPSPIPYPTFRPPLIPAKPRHGRIIVVSALGDAAVQPDVARIELAFEPPPPTVESAPNDTGPADDADIMPLLESLRTLFPSATIRTRYEVMHYGFSRSMTTIDRYRADVTVIVRKPDVRTFARASARLAAEAQHLGLTMRAGTIASLDSCEGVEDAARRDAIVRARTELRARANGGHHAQLIFADEQPTWFTSLCGPTIDTSILFGGGAPGFVATPIRATVPITLEYVLR